MRVHERHIQEKRRRRIARFQEIDRSRHRPERLRLLLRQMRRTSDPSVRGRPMGHGPAVRRRLAAQPRQVIVVQGARAVRHVHRLKAKAPPRRLQAQLAAQVCFIARVAQLARQRRRRIPFRVPGHPHHPVRRRRVPRHQHPARRRARRILRVPPTKMRPRSPNPVHRRRLQHRMPIQPQRIPPLLIRHHQQNIRPPLTHHLHSLPALLA